MLASHQYVWERQNQISNTGIRKTEKGNKSEVTNYLLKISKHLSKHQLFNTMTNRKIVFIQTASVIVSNSVSYYIWIGCRILFNSSSKRSYISKSLAYPIKDESIGTKYLATRLFEFLNLRIFTQKNCQS